MRTAQKFGSRGRSSQDRGSSRLSLWLADRGIPASTLNGAPSAAPSHRDQAGSSLFVTPIRQWEERRK